MVAVIALYTFAASGVYFAVCVDTIVNQRDKGIVEEMHALDPK